MDEKPVPKSSMDSWKHLHVRIRAHMSTEKIFVDALPKATTGIAGLDAITGGGLPRGRTTLVSGNAGSGKTVLALQTLVNGARLQNEPGIFVAFEESAARITANGATFGWDLPALQRSNLFFLDAQPSVDLMQSGGFDLQGMLAVLDAKVRRMQAKRVVFDSIDMVLALLEDERAVQREAYRLHEWLLEHGLSAIITKKSGYTTFHAGSLDFLEFMVDCALELRHEVVQGASQRNLRVTKYRGSGFDENEIPFVIAGGLVLANTGSQDLATPPVTSERLSSGIARLDTMLDGGYYRAASILVTGVPGTAKTTLSGCFAEAACSRGERTLFISFDSRSDELVRNLASVRIDLATHRASGMLRMSSMRAIAASAEVQLLRIRQLAQEHAARCVVVDPLSAIAKAGNDAFCSSVAERLIAWAKDAGITLFNTSLLDHANPLQDGTALQISTIADTWIHLSYVVTAGERNRALSIVKSRGTRHSNQVRELLLSDTGVTLTDVYTAGGEVLMGSLRFEKERANRLARAVSEEEMRLRQRRIESEALELEQRIARLSHELATKRAEQSDLTSKVGRDKTERNRAHDQIEARRGGDTEPDEDVPPDYA